MKKIIITASLYLVTGSAIFAQKPEAAFFGYSPGYTGTYSGHTDYSSWPGGYSGYRQHYFFTNGFRTVEEENRLMGEIEAAKKRERDKENTPAETETSRRAREARTAHQKKEIFAKK